MNHALPTMDGQHVLVLGLGASGLAMARWCTQAGARVTVADTRAAPPQAAQLAAELPQVALWHAEFDGGLFAREAWSRVCRSPGIAPSQMAALNEAAAAAGVPVVGELTLFAEALAALQAQLESPYRPQVVGITGTNGKTTTTALTAHLLREAGWSVGVAGNIGPTLLDTLAQALQDDVLPQAWVLELSSFQLDGVTHFEPAAATVLNLSQDHLDWHGTMEAYAAAKRRIFGQQGMMVLNRDDAVVMAWQPVPVAPVRQGSRVSHEPTRSWSTFGIDVPTRPGDWGMETVNGMTWLVRALPSDDAPARRKATDDTPCVLQRLMPAEALRIRGRHNACNALAALALATGVGAPLAPMLHALRDYRGEPHRVEPVAVVSDVEYVDDSKGTNVGATLAAIEGLGVDRRLLVILGGEGKGQDFSPLAPAVARHARAVALIGRDAPAIQAVLAPTGVPMQTSATLPEAVQWCAAQAQPGDVVLLSPACASFDMFRDYAHRAAVFVGAVLDLQQAEGTPA